MNVALPLLPGGRPPHSTAGPLSASKRTIETTEKGRTMGYARYEIIRNGKKIEAGYTVEAVCEEANCAEQIDRGLAHLCGAHPGGDEYGCGGYYCGQHLYGGVGPAEGLCARCSKQHDTVDA